MNAKTNRKSNIELLRIFAVMGVIILHLNNSDLGGIPGKSDRFGLCQFVIVFMGVFSVTAVNVFVLITGYFQSKKKSADLWRPLRLILDVIIFLVIFFFAYQFATGFYPLETYVNNFVSVNWFILTYAGLYILSPYINKMWNPLKGREKAVLVTLVFLLYSLYPSIIDFFKIKGLTTYGLDGDQRGYNIVNFVLMYLLGCAIRDAEENRDCVKKEISRIFHISGSSLKKSAIPLLLIVNTGIILAIIYLGAYLSGKHPYASIVFHYNNPFTVFESVLLLLIFKNLNIPDSKAVNYVARSAFYVYIIHLHFIRIFRISDFVTDDALQMLCFMICSTLLIYLVCFVCYVVYDQTFGRLLNIISKNWKKHRYIEVE